MAAKLQAAKNAHVEKHGENKHNFTKTTCCNNYLYVLDKCYALEERVGKLQQDAAKVTVRKKCTC